MLNSGFIVIVLWWRNPFQQSAKYICTGNDAFLFAPYQDHIMFDNTIMVFIMCAFTATFFFIVDRILGYGIGLVLG